MTARRRNGAQSVRLAAGPIELGRTTVRLNSVRSTLDFLSVTGHSMVMLVDHGGARSYGSFGSHTAEQLHALDVWLDSRDPANEDADGRLAA